MRAAEHAIRILLLWRWALVHCKMCRAHCSITSMFLHLLALPCAYLHCLVNASICRGYAWQASVWWGGLIAVASRHMHFSTAWCDMPL